MATWDDAHPASPKAENEKSTGLGGDETCTSSTDFAAASSVTVWGYEVFTRFCEGMADTQEDTTGIKRPRSASLRITLVAFKLVQTIDH